MAPVPRYTFSDATTRVFENHLKGFKPRRQVELGQQPRARAGGTRSSSEVSRAYAEASRSAARSPEVAYLLFARSARNLFAAQPEVFREQPRCPRCPGSRWSLANPRRNPTIERDAGRRQASARESKRLRTCCTRSRSAYSRSDLNHSQRGGLNLRLRLCIFEESSGTAATPIWEGKCVAQVKNLQLLNA